MKRSDIFIKTRKEHICSFCDGEIKAGETALYYEGKSPSYALDKNANDVQIGFYYWKNWLHSDLSICRSNGA